MPPAGGMRLQRGSSIPRREDTMSVAVCRTVRDPFAMEEVNDGKNRVSGAGRARDGVY